MKIKQLIILSFCLCGLAACEDIYKGGENHQQTEVAVLFKPSITSYDKDEVEKWKEGETVGVYMIRNKADFSLENSINQIFNKKMQVQADGMLKVSGEEPAFLYPTDATKVDFILYAPWNPSLEENVLQLDVRNQAKSDFCDYLYSNNAKNKYRTTTPVKVVFKHVFAKMIFHIRNGEGISAEDLKVLRLTCSDLPAIGKFSLGTAEMTEMEAGDIPVSVSSEGSYGECVLLPSTGNGLLLCDVAGNQYRKKIGNMTFEMGKQYTFDIVVSLPGIEVNLKEIEDWDVETFL